MGVRVNLNIHVISSISATISLVSATSTSRVELLLRMAHNSLRMLHTCKMLHRMCCG